MSFLSRVSSEKTLAFKEYALSLQEDYERSFDFSQKNLSGFVKFLTDRDLAESSIKAVIGEVLSYGRWLQERGYSIKLENSKPVPRVLREHRRANPFSEEELKEIFTAIRESFHPIYHVFSLLLLHSGIRLSEALP